MPRTILVTEGSSPLGAALVKLLAARGCSVAFTTDASGPGAAGSGAPGAVAPEAGAAEAGAALSVAPNSPLALAWNRRSPVSARTVAVSLQNAFETFDEALILEPSCTAAGPLNAVASADIERAFDDGKGTAFLAREVLAAFQGRGGTICFVSSPAGSGPVESAAHEAFRGLAASVLSAPGSAAIVANGFQCGSAAPEEYAAFIDRTLDEKARKITGRWFSYPARGGFLQGVFKTSSNP